MKNKLTNIAALLLINYILPCLFIGCIPGGFVIGEQVNVMLSGKLFHAVCMFERHRQWLFNHYMYTLWRKKFYNSQVTEYGTKTRNRFGLFFSYHLFHSIINYVHAIAMLFGILLSKFPVWFNYGYYFNVAFFIA